MNSFIEDHLELDPEADADEDRVFKLYRAWCADNGISRGVNKTNLAKVLATATGGEIKRVRVRPDSGPQIQDLARLQACRNVPDRWSGRCSVLKGPAFWASGPVAVPLRSCAKLLKTQEGPVGPDFDMTSAIVQETETDT